MPKYRVSHFCEALSHVHNQISTLSKPIGAGVLLAPRGDCCVQITNKE